MNILFRPHTEQISVCLPPVPQPEPEQGIFSWHCLFNDRNIVQASHWTDLGLPPACPPTRAWARVRQGVCSTDPSRRRAPKLLLGKLCAIKQLLSELLSFAVLRICTDRFFTGVFFLDPDSDVKKVENTGNYKTISCDLLTMGNDAWGKPRNEQSFNNRIWKNQFLI